MTSNLITPSLRAARRMGWQRAIAADGRQPLRGRALQVSQARCPGDYIIGNVAAIKKPERYQCQFVGKTHDADCLRVKSLTI